MNKKRKILIVMMDGFDPAYLQASDMPNTKRMIADGFYKTVKGMMPSVTNVNNTGICCGGPPSLHGITANSYFDLQTKKEEYMDKSSMVLAPTVFERAAKHGLKSALLTAKKKTQSLLRTGATIRLAAEAPQDAEGSDIDWIARLGPAPEIYSPEINHWLFRAAQIVLNETDMDLVYFHTTDYPMHMEPPWGDMSQFHLSEWDRLLGETLDAHPEMEVYMSADHGMNLSRAATISTRWCQQKARKSFSRCPRNVTPTSNTIGRLVAPLSSGSSGRATSSASPTSAAGCKVSRPSMTAIQRHRSSSCILTVSATCS